MKEIFEALKQCVADQQQAVLATIVSVEGSVYRQAGARCVIRQDGRIIGIVSGGCVEKDLFHYAEQVMTSGRCAFTEYDFRSEDDLIWGMGLGCNGALRLWLQPLDSVRHPEAAAALLDAWQRRMTTDVPYWTATLLESPLDPAGEGTTVVGERLAEHGLVLQGGIQAAGSSETWYVEQVLPRPHLVVIGAGADAAPVLQSAQFLQWRTTLIDHRKDWASATNFPGVEEFQIIKRSAYGQAQIPAGAAVVLMTHQYDLDFQALRNALQSDATYVGALGPSKRLNQMLAEWKKQGIVWRDGALARLYSPVGLDIGSETPEEIAFSIVAEVLANRNGRRGASLRERTLGSIHSEEATASAADIGREDLSGGGDQ